MKNFTLKKASITIAFSIFTCTNIFSQFTPVNLVVLQAGDGSTALANTGNAIVLKEFSPVGAPTFSVAISTSVNPLILSGSASSEGGLSLSPNGKYLVFSGYAQSLPNATALAGSASSVISRGIGIVNVAGSYSQIATSNTFYSANNIRSAASDGNNNYWASGANDGTDYFGIASPTVNVQNSNINTRSIGIFNNSLFFSTGSGTLIGVYQIGNGLPVVAAQTNTSIISTMSTGIGTPSPYSFYFNPTQTICYIADDRTIANGGGIQKWVFSANTWSLAYTLGTGSLSTVGARGVIADFTTPNVKVYATTTETSANRLISIVDAGSGSPALTIATSGTNTLFRGVAFSPYCTEPSITSIVNNAPICANQSLTLDVNPTGTAPYTYSWTGVGTFNTNSIKNPTVTGASTGNYSVSVSNGCGNITSGVSVTINPLPIITVNSSTICAGGNATLNAIGANTYTWNTSSNSPTIIVTPTTSTNYTISGTSALGCSNSATVMVVVTGTPAISVNSATICSGNSATLNASGVSTYTWNTGSNSPSITPSPSVTTTYTVAGNTSGCPLTVSNTTTVFVNALPSVTLSPLTSPICLNSSTIALGGTPSGGSFSGAGVTGNTFNPSTAGVGTFTISYSFTNTSNCSSVDAKTVTVSLCTGTSENSKNNIINVYPNPVKNNIKINVNNNQEYKLEIYSPDGKLVYIETSVEPVISIETSNYSSGLYIIRISTIDCQSFIKFIKE
ncbi:MAG: T9SS type A sorting domain-containing protein [Bacteroidota bacterium]